MTPSFMRGNRWRIARDVDQHDIDLFDRHAIVDEQRVRELRAEHANLGAHIRRGELTREHAIDERRETSGRAGAAAPGGYGWLHARERAIRDRPERAHVIRV